MASFEVFKQGKLADQLEERAYEWCAWQIEETFGLERSKNEWGFEQPIEELLNEEQVESIEAYLDTNEWIEMYVRSALQGIVDRWHMEQPNPDDDEPVNRKAVTQDEMKKFYNNGPHIGARENDDGTWDMSAAARMATDDDEGYEISFSEDS